MELSRRLDATPGNYSGKARTELDADLTGPSDRVNERARGSSELFGPCNKADAWLLNSGSLDRGRSRWLEVP